MDEATCKNMVENMLRQARQEDRAFMTNLVTTEIKTLRTEMMKHIDKCTDELEETHLQVDVQVEDAISCYMAQVQGVKENFKTEMRGFVTGRLDEVQKSAAEDVEERVMNRLNGARVLIGQARIGF